MKYFYQRRTDFALHLNNKRLMQGYISSMCVCLSVCVFVRARSQERRHLRIRHLHSLLMWWYWRRWSINFLYILNIFGINSNLPNIEVSFISLKRSFVKMSNFDTTLPVRLSNYMWSFIKFRQLVKSHETIVIRN